MASSTNNVKLGVCSITFGGVDLGYTKGGVEVEVATETFKVMIDQFGNTPIKEYITARTCIVRVPLAETTLDNIVATMPGSTKIVDTTKERVDVVTNISADLKAIAQVLSLHPVSAGADLNEDFTVPLAATGGALSYAYKLDEERIFNVEFNAYPDDTQGGLLFQIGDLTAV